ncbi:MAG: hypothetical protein A2787_02020 [Omnitrophica WOR_2 bacterium RIFCSPHIGHO2_01_FULL_48_9]|nr:MAG: hypothetical protein A3D10_05295 [Omnitrophica WOR_2 bacterium RIFCSPHIGHO2_02_FULL_48_11]OGX34396.1 MAG: hypothetical protein A2787_02020 [Omnitrophica WOR_2 bacterium RIFCSPHIGHO2_01_FULL_48_9]
MRTWYKYLVIEEADPVRLEKDRAAQEHQKTMGGYSTDRGYASKEEFFRTYVSGGDRRYRYYHEALKECLNKEEAGLSIGSGRCGNELFLMEEGYNIVCSDLENYCEERTSDIFEKMKFVKYDVMAGPFPGKFDYIFSLNVLYLFPREQLLKVFQHVAESLKDGGRFIVDPGGAEDNLYTALIDNWGVRWDAQAQAFLKTMLKRSKKKVFKKHHGYRCNNKEFVAVAEEAGFKFEGLKTSDYVTELKDRMLLFHGLPESAVRLLGWPIPYVRLFNFRKIQ